jgi:hypothetical protein
MDELLSIALSRAAGTHSLTRTGQRTRSLARPRAVLAFLSDEACDVPCRLPLKRSTRRTIVNRPP